MAVSRMPPRQGATLSCLAHSVSYTKTAGGWGGSHPLETAAACHLHPCTDADLTCLELGLWFEVTAPTCPVLKPALLRAQHTC